MSAPEPDPAEAVDTPTRWWHRLWPASIFGRLAIVLLAGFLLMQVAGLVAWLMAPDEIGYGGRMEAFGRRIAAFTRLYEESAPATRARLIEATTGPFFEVAWQQGPPEARDGFGSDGLQHALGPALRGLGSREIMVSSMHGWGPPRAQVAVALLDGGWLSFRVGPPQHFPGGPWRPTFWLVLTLAAVVVALWIAQRTARPLERFAAAADRFGRELEAPHLPELGSREIKRAARAFNRMQARIKRLVEDRAMMLAAVSHDLRTGLTRLKLRTDFIEDEEQRAKAVADIETMRQMLAEMLAFARDDAAAEPRRPVDLAQLLQDLCEDSADAGNRVSYDGPAHLSVVGRPVALRRLFLNLLDNAVRYGGAAALRLNDSRTTIEAAILDRGPGIPEAERERVFSPFYRLDSSRSRETGGAGLGLAIARAIARRHGGDIVLAEREGGGLAATVTLLKEATPL